VRKRTALCIVTSVLAMAAVAIAIAGIAVDKPAALPTFVSPDFSTVEASAVSRVIDGDTIVVQVVGKDTTVRLIGVDTPETVHPRKPQQPYGREASLFLTNLLKGEGVYLFSARQGPKTDRYGRTLAYVYRAPDGLFVNAEIIRQGYGIAYLDFPFVERKRFTQLQAFAKRAGKGMWQDMPVAKASSPTTQASPLSRSLLEIDKAKTAFKAKKYGQCQMMYAWAAWLALQAKDEQLAQECYYNAARAALAAGNDDTCYQYALRAGTMKGYLTEQARAMAEYWRYEKPPADPTFGGPPWKPRDRGKPPWR